MFDAAVKAATPVGRDPGVLPFVRGKVRARPPDPFGGSQRVVERCRSVTEPLCIPQAPSGEGSVDLVVAQLVEELARCQQRELDRPRLEALRATLGDAQTPSD